MALQTSTSVPAPALWTSWDIVKAIAVVVVGTLVAGVPAALLADGLLQSGQKYEDDALA